MRRTFYLIMSILFLLALSACGSEENSEAEEEEYEDYPEKEIEFIVQYGAGGATDLVYRPVIEKIEEEFDGNIVIENVPEGGGIKGAQEIANAEPDGYTVGVLSAGQTVMAPLFRDDIPVGLDDYEKAGSVGSYLYGVIAPKDAPYDDFEEFLEYVQENDGELVASTIPSNVYEIFYTWLKNEYDVDFDTIPFDSAADTSTAVQDGSADFSVGLTSADNDKIESGELKLIAPLGESRWPVEEDIETAQEQGYEDVNVETILGIGLPKGTPEPIVEKWDDALQKALEDPEIQEKLEDLSTEPNYLDSEEFENYLNELDNSFKNMTDKD